MRKVGKIDSRGKDRVQTVNNDPSETVQSDAHLADIQNIMKQYSEGGMQQLDETELMFRDVSEFTDFHDVMISVKEAEVEFMKLPPQVRLIFHNSVETWLDSAHDEDKRNALIAGGWIKGANVDEAVPAAEGAAESKTPAPAEGAG